MIKLIKGKAEKAQIKAIDMVFTDPPFEMSGKALYNILQRFEFAHLLLICTMRQALELHEFIKDDFKFGFDLVISHVSPKKSKNYAQPNALHSNVLYFYRESSAFDRRRITRHDIYSEAKGYYPSIFHAPKINLSYKYQKNQNVINDLLGSFAIKSVLDPFAGSGTTALACIEHGIDGVMIEALDAPFLLMQSQCTLLTHEIEIEVL